MQKKLAEKLREAVQKESQLAKEKGELQEREQNYAMESEERELELQRMQSKIDEDKEQVRQQIE